MPTYITLVKWTQQGVQSIKDAPKRRTAGKEAAAAMGIKWHQAYMVMGQYDVVLLYEAPDDDTATKFALNLGMSGNFSTQTMRAYTEAEADALIATLG